MIQKEMLCVQNHTLMEIIGPNDSKEKTIEVEVTSQQLRDFKDQGSLTHSIVRGVCVQ